MKKLCILGGGSLNTPLLIYNFLKYPELKFDEIFLFDINKDNLTVVGNYCNFLIEKYALVTKINFGTNLEEAVADATYILNKIRVGDAKTLVDDRHHLILSGITGHAASYAEAVRILPIIFDYLPIIEKYAPNALLINFSNPVSIICEAIALYSKINCIGLCYHTTLMKNDFARLLNVSPSKLIINSFGINHFSWVVDVLVNGESRFDELLNLIIEQKLKSYNYEFVKSLNIIPIGHTYSLLQRGCRFFDPAQGKKDNFQNIIYKFLTPKRLLINEFLKRQKIIIKAYECCNVDILEELNKRNPWYEVCIAPFLRDFEQQKDKEYYILTIRNIDCSNKIKSATIETNCEVVDNQVKPVKTEKSIPDFCQYAVQNIVNSENLMIKANKKKSKNLALESMLIHFNVYSQECAEKFLQFFFRNI